MATGFITKKVPWTNQPPHRVETFDQSNFYGKRCVWAAIPGWDVFHGLEDVADSGGIHTVGQKMFMAANTPATGSGAELSLVVGNYGHGIGTAKASRHFSANTAENASARFWRQDADLGIIFPDPKNLTILTICRPIGDGRGGANPDPRVFSKDLGTAANDHDLMIGTASSGNEARTRIRYDGSSTATVLAGSSNGGIQDDSLNLIAGIVEQTSASAVSIHCWHIREDGKTQNNSTNVSGEYTPRTTTGMAIGANANATGNNKFHGEVIGVWAFDGAFNDVNILRRFFYNPWQVFQPQTQRIPIFLADAGGVSESYPWHYIEQGSVTLEGAGMGGRLIE